MTLESDVKIQIFKEKWPLKLPLTTYANSVAGKSLPSAVGIKAIRRKLPNMHEQLISH